MYISTSKKDGPVILRQVKNSPTKRRGYRKKGNNRPK
jgi:hypothetical protein